MGTQAKFLRITSGSSRKILQQTEAFKKYYLRSTMSQDRLVDLARLSIESEISRKINLDNVITRFALKRDRNLRKAPLNAIVK
jgi:hypothetical protein